MDIQGGYCDAEELRDACGDSAEILEGALRLNEDHWRGMADEINEWSRAYWVAQPEYKAYTDRKSALENIERKLGKLPTLATIERQLGKQKAEIYREALEVLESSERWGAAVSFNDDNGASTVENEQMVRLACSVSDNATNEEGLLAEYEQWRAHKSRMDRTQRERIEQKNARQRKAVRLLGIWLPNQDDRWLSEPGGAEFLKLAERCRAAMRRQKCVLQFVPRRNYHPPNVRDMARNAEIMRAYLGEGAAPASEK